jgi:hypothetical protein
MAILLPKYKGFKQERQIGEYKILLPDPPDIAKIAYHNKPKEDQKFIPTALPKDILSWDASSRNDFESQEWEKRKKGFWFFNNGNLEYLTGPNYFYINWWRIDIGLPSFVDSDRDWFYMWMYTKENPNARGFINIENRRGGKTYRAISCVYEETSRTPNSQAGIQSKNNADAEKVFKKVVFSWKKLPYFFKPVDMGESNPKTKLEFSEPSRRDTKNQKKEYGLVLDSFIDYENAKEEAYDGVKQLVNFQDEIGKTSEVNVDERIKIVKECVMDGSRIVGKIIGTTTVEEMEKKGGKHCKKVWDGADPTRLLPNGQTQNGLLRYFKSADYGFRGYDKKGKPFIDEYGYSDKERARVHIEENRKALRDKDDVISDRRKYPLSIQDCFIQDSKKAVYDTARIEQQLEHNRTLPDNILVRGNFQWRDGKQDTEVVWVPSENGRWLIAWLPKLEDRNKSITKYSLRSPANVEQGCFGLDPYDNKTTVDNRKSDAASYGLRKFNPMEPYNTGIFISEYVNRPRLPEVMWEDMILQSVFYGWEVLVESNKIGTINHFRRRGYLNYLMKRPEETQTVTSQKMEEPGIPMSGDEARLALIHASESYVVNKVGLIEEQNKEPYMGKCYFDKLLNNWLEFDFDRKWTEFDSMVGAGLAILGSRKYMPKKIDKKPVQFFSMYNNNGIESHKIVFRDTK